MNPLNPEDFIITRKRKKYKFALFANYSNCFEADQWPKGASVDILEMGAGTGLFSAALAEQYPDRKFLAVDVKADRLQSGAKQALDKKLENISFLRARADQLNELIVAGSLHKIWITFPDPFPRERSAKHRLTHPKYLDLYQSLLRPNGSLHFKTDAEGLFTWSLEQLVASGWIIKELSFDLHSSNLAIQYKIMTTYESRYYSEGRKIGFIKATCSSSVDANI